MVADLLLLLLPLFDVEEAWQVFVAEDLNNERGDTVWELLELNRNGDTGPLVKRGTMKHTNG